MAFETYYKLFELFDVFAYKRSSKSLLNFDALHIDILAIKTLPTSQFSR